MAIGSIGPNLPLQARTCKFPVKQIKDSRLNTHVISTTAYFELRPGPWDCQSADIVQYCGSLVYK